MRIWRKCGRSRHIAQKKVFREVAIKNYKWRDVIIMYVSWYLWLILDSLFQLRQSVFPKRHC